ncbi:MAG: hypothetical protein PWQ97_499 [Tepidanaerobacteraceae bacterium]|nr:hypothetical protein [Tepidanaerobacteraceae bacterium]
MSQVSVKALASTEMQSPPEIVFENGSAYSVDLVDSKRREGKIAIYTRNYGEITPPFSDNTIEFVVVNNLITYINTRGERGTYIPTDGYVVSCTKSGAEFVKNLFIGEEVTLSNLKTPEYPQMYFKLGDMVIPIDNVNSVRGANQVILYDSSYGDSTETNGWGMELTVTNNVVSNIVDMRKSGSVWINNDSPIPSDGAVISVHRGSPYYDLLHERAKIGDEVEIFADNIKLYSAGRIAYDAYNPVSLEDNPAAWDEDKQKPFDGYRGPDQMIIYDENYGSRTGTNPYGYEVVVGKGGKIIKTGGNDLEIPDEGYILSAHGDKGKLLQKYALLGSTVVLNKSKREVRIIFNPNSYLFMAEASIKSAEETLKNAKTQFLDIDYNKVQKVIDSAKSKLKNAQALLNQEKYRDLINTVKQIQNDADNAYFMSFESIKVENRAVWLRPRETNADEVKKHLDMLKNININTVYLETYWNGYSIYPTKNDIMNQNPIYRGFDVLDAYIKQAHARGIKLHAWVEDFLVGPDVAAKKPEWMAVSRTGKTYFQDSNKNIYYHLNPALPEVRDFLSGLYLELVKKYDLDGIQLDYMRYPASGDYTDDFGYDSYTRKLFETYNGCDPSTLHPGDELWDRWCEFRRNIISSFVYRIVSEIKSVKPNMKISADVRPDYDKAVVDTYQDARDWTTKDYINNLIPMCYYLYDFPVEEDVKNTWAFARGHSQVTVGIATFTKIDKKMLVKQICAVRDANTNGIGIFEFESLFDGGFDSALKLGVFSKPAITTDSDPQQSIKAVLEDVLRKIDTIYIKYGGLNILQAEKYRKLIKALMADFNCDRDKIEEAGFFKNEVQDLLDRLSHDESLNKEVAKRIGFDLYSIMNIIDENISANRFLANHKVKYFQVEISLKALRSEKAVPMKVKAVFDDDTSALMYLDSTQYIIKSSYTDVAEITKNVLQIKSSKKTAKVTVEILDAFKFNTADGVNKKIEFEVNPHKEDIVNPAYANLTVQEVSDTKVILDWSGPVMDSDIAGFILYRNGSEIARISGTMFCDSDLRPDSVYFYKVYGFDASGRIVFRSREQIVKTKIKYFH